MQWKLLMLYLRRAREEGMDKIRFSVDIRTEAVDKFKEWASDTNASVFVHRKDGTVETTHNYS
jgi:hypothetical protein